MVRHKSSSIAMSRLANESAPILPLEVTSDQQLKATKQLSFDGHPALVEAKRRASAYIIRSIGRSEYYYH